MAKCAYCGEKVERFAKRGNRPYKYCSADCDKAAMGVRMSKLHSGNGKQKQIVKRIFVKTAAPVDYRDVVADLELRRDALANLIESLKKLKGWA